MELITSGSALLESALRAANASLVTGVFFWLISAWFLVALVCYKKDNLRSLTHYTPNLLTSLGMLGTFIGIVIGLLHFDPEDIDGSISLLLGGLQTAFMTSLYGMAMTMIYKVFIGFPPLQPKADVASGPDEIGPEHIHQLLREQNDNLERLHQAIAGDDSDTLTGQIRLLRQHQDDNHKALNTHAERQRERFDAFASELSAQMRDFAEMMSKSATEKVIEALNRVIQDFNQKLTEQFGKNFEELNQAVKAMIEWQENYRQQLGEMSDQYAQGVTAITSTEQSVAHISEKASAIPEAMQGLEVVLTTTQRQLADLEAHLGAFADMRDKAVDAVPEVRRQIEETVNNISTTSQQAAKELAESSARVHESLQSTSDQVSGRSEEIAQQFRQANENVSAQIRELMEQLASQTTEITGTLSEANNETHQQLTQLQRKNAEALENMQSEHQRALTDTSQHYQQQLSSLQQQFQSALRESMQETGSSISKQIEALDNSLQQELENVMSHMGGALVQISDRFTSDYQKLTSEMHKVVSAANAGSYS